MTIEEFVSQNNITVDLKGVPDNPHMADSRNMLNYLAEIQFNNRSMSVYFSTGAGWVEDKQGNFASGFEYDLQSKKIVPSKSWGRRTITIYEVENATRKYRIRS